MKILSALIFSLLITTQSFAINIDSLLIKSVGGEKALESIKRLSTIHIKGSANMNKLYGTYEYYFKMPDKFYTSYTFPSFSMVQAYDGKMCWIKDLNGQIANISGIEKQEMLKSLYLNSYSYLSSDSLNSNVIYIKDTIIQNRNSHQLAFILFENDTMFAYFDAKSGLRKLFTSRIDQIITENHEYSYEQIDNINFPSYIHSIIKAANFSMKFYTEEITLNEQVNDQIFLKPDTQIVDYYFPSDKDKIEIDFQYLFGHIRLPAVINGKLRVWMILDSGAASNIFNKKAVDSLKLETVGSLPAMGISGFEEVKLLQTDSIQIGSLTLFNQVAGAMNLEQMDRLFKTGDFFGGILGYDFLSRFPVMVDYTRKKLIVFNPNKFSPPSGGTEVPFDLTMQIPTIKGSVNGVKGDFIVDLGNAFGLVLHQKFVESNRLDETISNLLEDKNMIGGVGGSLSGKRGTIDKFTMGQITLENQAVVLPETSVGLTGSEQISGNIGNQLLQNFLVLFDYNNSRLIFYNNEE